MNVFGQRQRPIPINKSKIGLFSLFRKLKIKHTHTHTDTHTHTHTHTRSQCFVLSLRTICKLPWCFLLSVFQQSSSCPPWRASRGHRKSTRQRRTAFSMPQRSRSIFSMTYTVFNTILSRPRTQHFKSISRQQPSFSIQDHITWIKCLIKAIKTCSKPSLPKIWD